MKALSKTCRFYIGSSISKINQIKESSFRFVFIQSSGISIFSRELLIKREREKAERKKAKPVQKEETKIEDTEVAEEKKAAVKMYNPVEILEDLKRMELDDRIKKNNSLHMSLQLYIKGPQVIRGVRKCPGGSEYSPKICVFTSSAFADAAINAGADKIADTDTYEELYEKKINYDMFMATTDVINQVKTLGKILGPLNLMPSPKVGTVVEPDQIEEAVRGFKQGNKEFRVGKNGNLQLIIGKYRYGDENLLKNLHAFLVELESKRPETSRAKFIIKAYISLGGVSKSYPVDLNSINLKNKDYFGHKFHQDKEGKKIRI